MNQQISLARSTAALSSLLEPDPQGLRAALLRALGSQAAGPELLHALCLLGRTRQLRAGETLLRAGEGPVDGLWLLLAGQAAAGKRDARGRWWQSRELRAGDWIDLASAWRAPATALETVEALTPLRVHEFPAIAVLSLCDGEPGLMQALVRALADQLAASTQDRQALLTHDVSARLAAWLLEQHAAAGGSEELRLSQQKRLIASQLGITPETLSRTLKALQQQGLLLVDKYLVQICDLAGLRQLAARMPPLYSR